jgi:hypothetical protein
VTLKQHPAQRTVGHRLPARAAYLRQGPPQCHRRASSSRAPSASATRTLLWSALEAYSGACHMIADFTILVLSQSSFMFAADRLARPS